MTEELREVVQSLVERVQELEDRLAITQLMAAYGPAADAGLPDKLVTMFEEDSYFDAAPGLFLDGREGITDHLMDDIHKRILANGAAHVISTPYVQLNGDRAVATAYSQVIYRDQENDRFYVWRISANRWEWLRTDGVWRVTARVNRPLDGTPAARELFSSAFGTNDVPVQGRNTDAERIDAK